MQNSFFQKTILITGASRGIGRALALRLAPEKMNILIHYRSNIEEAKKVAAEVEKLGSKAYCYAADLSNAEDVEKFIEQILANHPQIDYYIANAAATAFKPLAEIKSHHIQKTFQITLSSFILMLNAFISRMPPHSKVITLSGIDTLSYCKNHGLLAAAKSALETLTRYYAIELKEKKIFVLGLNPGLVDTDSIQFYWGKNYQSQKEALSELNTNNKLTSPEEVAELLYQLLLPQSEWYNGQTLVADGGLSFRMPVYGD